MSQVKELSYYVVRRSTCELRDMMLPAKLNVGFLELWGTFKTIFTVLIMYGINSCLGDLLGT